MNWYSRRYVRILLPYFMIMTPYYFLHMILCNESICDFFLNLSTISFWTKHEGQWFLDALLPIYLLSPFLYYGFTKDKYRHILLCLLIILCILVLNIPNNSSQPNQTILGNIQYVVKRVPGFIVGMWMAKYVKEAISIQHPIAKLTAALICVVLVEKIVPLDIPIAWACVIPIIFLVATVCQYVGDSVRSMLRFMGGISLESYLFNVTLPFFIPYLSWQILKIDLSFGMYVPYATSIILGIILSYVVSHICHRITSK